MLKPTAYTARYLVTVLEKDQQYATGKLLLSISMDSVVSNLNVDDELVFSAFPKVISKPLNPHLFNYQKYMRNQGVLHQVSLKKEACQSLSYTSSTLKGIAAKLRKKLIKKMEEQAFGAEELSIIKALILGERNSITETTYTNYKNAGALHLLAISGLHIGVLLLIIQLSLIHI